jgi:hypothetical protein
MANKAGTPLAIVVSVPCAKCLIESVLVNKRLPNRLPNYRYEGCNCLIEGEWQSLLIAVTLQQRIRTDTIRQAEDA